MERRVRLQRRWLLHWLPQLPLCGWLLLTVGPLGGEDRCPESLLLGLPCVLVGVPVSGGGFRGSIVRSAEGVRGHCGSRRHVEPLRRRWGGRETATRGDAPPMDRIGGRRLVRGALVPGRAEGGRVERAELRHEAKSTGCSALTITTARENGRAGGSSRGRRWAHSRKLFRRRGARGGNTRRTDKLRGRASRGTGWRRGRPRTRRAHVRGRVVGGRVGGAGPGQRAKSTGCSALAITAALANSGRGVRGVHGMRGGMRWFTRHRRGTSARKRA